MAQMKGNGLRCPSVPACHDVMRSVFVCGLQLHLVCRKSWREVHGIESVDKCGRLEKKNHFVLKLGGVCRSDCKQVGQGGIKNQV